MTLNNFVEFNTVQAYNNACGCRNRWYDFASDKFTLNRYALTDK